MGTNSLLVNVSKLTTCDYESVIQSLITNVDFVWLNALAFEINDPDVQNKLYMLKEAGLLKVWDYEMALNSHSSPLVDKVFTVDEYKEDLKKKLLENKEAALKREKEEDVVGKIIENATMEIPDPMVDTQVRQMVDDFARRIQAQGLSIEQYFQFTGMEPQAFLEQMKPQALKRIQSRLVLEAVVAAENIEASEEDIQKEMENMASMYQMDLAKLKEVVGEHESDSIKKDIAVQKAVDLVVDAAKEV